MVRTPIIRYSDLPAQHNSAVPLMLLTTLNYVTWILLPTPYLVSARQVGALVSVMLEPELKRQVLKRRQLDYCLVELMVQARIL